MTRRSPISAKEIAIHKMLGDIIVRVGDMLVVLIMPHAPPPLGFKYRPTVERG